MLIYLKKLKKADFSTYSAAFFIFFKVFKNNLIILYRDKCIKLSIF